MLRTRELLAEPSLRKRSGTYLPKYLRIPNALRLDGQNPQGAERALYSAYSTRVCYGASPSAFFRNIYHRTFYYEKTFIIGAIRVKLRKEYERSSPLFYILLQCVGG